MKNRPHPQFIRLIDNAIVRLEKMGIHPAIKAVTNPEIEFLALCKLKLVSGGKIGGDDRQHLLSIINLRGFVGDVVLTESQMDYQRIK